MSNRYNTKKEGEKNTMKLQPKPSKNGFLKVRNEATGTLFYTSNALKEAWESPNWSLQNVRWAHQARDEDYVELDIYSARLSNGEIYINFIWTYPSDPDEYSEIQFFWYNHGDHQFHRQSEDSEIYDCETGKPIRILHNEYDDTPPFKIKTASKEEIEELEEEENDCEEAFEQKHEVIFEMPRLEWLEEALIEAINNDDEEEEEQIQFELCPKAEKQIEEAFSDLF